MDDQETVLYHTGLLMGTLSALGLLVRAEYSADGVPLPRLEVVINEDTVVRVEILP